MKRADGALVAALVGVFAVIVGQTDLINRYLRPSMSRWLVLSGLVLVALGLALLVAGWLDRRRADGGADPGAEPHHDEDDHRHGFSRVGWFLLLPLVFAVVVNPGALGSYAAGRQTSTRDLASLDFDLEEHLLSHSFGGQAASLNVAQVAIAANDPEQHDRLRDQPLLVEGFVVNRTGETPGLLLGRIMVGCCAGDGFPITVELSGYDGPPLEDDQWLRVEGTLDIESTLEAREDVPQAPPVLSVSGIEEIPDPKEPYLYPF